MIPATAILDRHTTLAAILVTARAIVADPARWCARPHALDAICEGADARPWAPDGSRLPVPDEFREKGTPPLVTLDPDCPHGTLEVTRGTVRFRFVNAAATVTTELSDPPPAPQNKPVVTVKRRPDGAPDILVQGGKAIVRVEDWQQKPAPEKPA